MSIEECRKEFYEMLESEGAVLLTGATDKQLHYMGHKKHRVRKKYQNMVVRRSAV